MSNLEAFAEEGTLAPPGRNPYRDEKSIEFRFRSRRFVVVQQLIEAILREKGSADILDMGGTEDYWLIGRDFLKTNRHRISITLINTAEVPVEDHGLFNNQIMDAAVPGIFGERRFDLVHSNSVIEHVGDWQRMLVFAANARRLAPRYYIQTPNYWFPYEPHFRFAGFQYLPEALRMHLIMSRPLGFFRRIESRDEAREIIDTHRLLSTRQMRRAFPDGVIRHETVFGLRKSIIAVRDR